MSLSDHVHRSKLKPPIPWWVVRETLLKIKPAAVDVVAGRYDAYTQLNMLEALGFSRRQIVECDLEGRLNETLLSRIANHAPNVIDVSGLDNVALDNLFSTQTMIARQAIEAERLMRLASLRLDRVQESAESEIYASTRDRLHETIEEAELKRRRLQAHLARLSAPRTENETYEHLLDTAASQSLFSLIALHKKQWAQLLERSESCWTLSLKLTQRKKGFSGATYLLVRSACNAYFSAEKCEGRQIKQVDDVGPRLASTIATMTTDIFYRSALAAVSTTLDERIAGNLAQAFALAQRPDHAAKFVRLVLPAEYRSVEHLKRWKPPQWDEAVFAQPYMSSTLTLASQRDGE